MTAATAQEDNLIRQFKARVPSRVEYPECDAVFFRAALKKKLEEALEETELENQISHPSETTFLECPSCGSGVDFSK